MNSVEKERNEGRVNSTAWVIDGELTIQRAGELKTALETVLDTNEKVQIQFGDVNTVDLSFLQILCSAHRTAVAQEKELTITGDAPELFRQAIREAGLVRHVGCHLDPHKDCLWKES